MAKKVTSVAAGGEESQTEPVVSPVSALLDLEKDAPDREIKRLVNDAVSMELKNDPLSASHNVLVLYDPTTLTSGDADRIYRAVTQFVDRKPILLILSSNGGSAEAAYFIAKLCREYTQDRVIVAVPRRAKSAATLICCAADEIHMGSLSELGPIDPQFDEKPALGLKNSIEHIAELVKKYPAASEMFSSYLAKSLKLENLGYYERVAQSAVQYAERLLKARSVQAPDARVTAIANKLVYDYKDHGFAIDAGEASEIFGADVVKVNTDIYRLANSLYDLLDLLRIILKTSLERGFYFIGSAGSGCWLLRS